MTAEYGGERPRKRRRSKKKTKRRRYTRRRKSSQKKKKITPGPLWNCKAGDIHPELKRVLEKPFVSSVGIDEKGCYSFPLGDGRYASLQGIHTRLRRRYFRGEKTVERKATTSTRNFPSGKAEGERAGRHIDYHIRGESKKCTNAYARAVLKYWEENGHTVQASEIPVILTKANIGTRGDCFTVDAEGKLWLWELKTGYPYEPEHPNLFAAPLLHVKSTPRNKWQLQLLYTRWAYERELGMKIDRSAVINAWKHRSKDGSITYKCETYDPPAWTTELDADFVYQQL